MTADVRSIPDGHFALKPDESTFSFHAKAFLLFPVRGTICARTGTISVGDGKIHAEGTADATSVSTGVKPRDWHLRHRQYLHAATHPDIRLVVPPVAADASGVVATLYARGKSVDVALNLDALEVSPDGELHARVTGAFDRTPLGMLPPLAGVSRRVQLTLDIVATT